MIHMILIIHINYLILIQFNLVMHDFIPKHTKSSRPFYFFLETNSKTKNQIPYVCTCTCTYGITFSSYLSTTNYYSYSTYFLAHVSKPFYYFLARMSSNVHGNLYISERPCRKRRSCAFALKSPKQTHGTWGLSSSII